MAHVLRRVAVLVLVLASAACGGGDDGGPSFPAPTGLTAGPGATFDDVILTWTPPDGAFDGYVIEVRVGSGAFEEIMREPAPPGTVGAIITVNPAVPELVTLGFRVRAYSGANDSAPTNVATTQRGVRAPVLELPIEIGTGPDGTASGPVVLRWSASSLVASTVQAERAVLDPIGGAGPFSALAVAYPAESLEDSDLTPGTAYVYRVRHGRDGIFSAWAEAATPAIDWPIHAPADLVAAPTLAGFTRVDPITVTWTNASALADALELSRAEVLEGGGLGPWTVLPAAFPATRFVDEDVVDPKAYAYRLRYSQGALQSAIVEVRSEPVDLLVPRDLTVTRTESGYHLAWTNRSTTATALRLGRTTIGADDWPPPGPPVLPATDTSYDDARAAAWPGSRYTVTAAREPYYLAPSAAVEIPAPELTAPIALRGTTAVLPAGLTAARDSQLRFHVHSSGATTAIHRPTAEGWELHELPGPYAALPRIEVDGLDHPHSFYRTLVDPQAGRIWTLTHVWHDGTAWQTEDAATRISPPGYIEGELFGVSAAGVVHVFFDTDGGSLYSMVHAVRAPAGWVETPLAPTTVADPFPVRTAADVAPDGTAYFAFLLIERPPAPEPQVTRVVLFTRAPDGTWTEEIAPTGAVSVAGGLAMIGMDGGAVGLVYGRNDAGDELPDEYWFVGRQGGTWGAPERVTVRGNDERMALAWRPSDGRLHAVLQGTPPGAELANLCARAAGAWSCAPFAPWPMYGAFATGYRPDGKAWALAFPTPGNGLYEAALYEEP